MSKRLFEIESNGKIFQNINDGTYLGTKELFEGSLQEGDFLVYEKLGSGMCHSFTLPAPGGLFRVEKSYNRLPIRPEWEVVDEIRTVDYEPNIGRGPQQKSWINYIAK